MTTKGRMTPDERDETLADMRHIVHAYDDYERAFPNEGTTTSRKIAASLRRAIEELEAGQ